MNSDDSLSAQRMAPAAPSRSVTLSPWINEQFPDWEQLLSAHDVARLTRRPRWMLAGLTFVGRFPRKSRYHGRAIGWLRSDVLTWLAKDLHLARLHGTPIVGCSCNARQGQLPLGWVAGLHIARRRRRSCMDLKPPSRPIGARWRREEQTRGYRARRPDHAP
jgi:predicted DNA-binding transcriptional regulator AlpA